MRPERRNLMSIACRYSSSSRFSSQGAKQFTRTTFLCPGRSCIDVVRPVGRNGTIVDIDRPAKALQGGFMSEPVRTVMTRNPTCCKQEMSLQQVAKMMVDHDCGCIPVVGEDGRSP